MTLGIILPAVLAFMLLVVDFFFLWMIYRQLKQVWFMNFPWGKTESVDVSEQNIPLPDDAQPFVQLLEQFGFTLLGITQVRLFWNRNHPIYEWVFINGDKTIYLELVDIKFNKVPLVGFHSWFQNNALLETYYPIGENIDEPNYTSHFAKGGLGVAYDYHVNQLIELHARHGELKRFENMRQFLQHEPNEEKDYRKRRYRRFTRICLLCAVLEVVEVIISTGMILAIWLPKSNQREIVFPVLFSAAIFFVNMWAILRINNAILNPPNSIDARRKGKSSP